MPELIHTPSVGRFLLSFDTELAWGHFDCFDPELFSADGARERGALRNLLDLLSEYDVAATWAVVGKLFDPDYPEAWRGRYPAFEALHDRGSPLLHGVDFVETLLKRQVGHEIACHGYTHRMFNALTSDEARDEIARWIEAALRWDVALPRTVIFPRNRVGHLDAFCEAGFICYRGVEVQPWTHTLPVIGRGFRRYSEYIGLVTPPETYALPTFREGTMVNLPASRWLFGVGWRVQNRLDRLGLRQVRTERIIQGVKTAARMGQVIHLWAHPFEFRSSQDIDMLRAILRTVADERENGRLESVTMGDLAARIQAEGEYARLDA